VARLRPHHRMPGHRGRGRRNVLRTARDFPRNRRADLDLWAVCRPRYDRRPSRFRREFRARRRNRCDARPDEPHRFARRGNARLGIYRRAGHLAVERRRRHQGDVRRAQRRLRRDREARLRSAESDLALAHVSGDRLPAAGPGADHLGTARAQIPRARKRHAMGHRSFALAPAVRHCQRGVGRALPLRAKPKRVAVAMGNAWESVRGPRVDRSVAAVLMVRGEFRQLQQDLWVARRDHRLHDLDLAFDHRDPGRGRNRRGSGTPDRPRHDCNPPETDGEHGATMADTVGAAQD